MEKESLREKFKSCLLYHLYAAGQSLHGVGGNVRLLVFGGSRNFWMQLPQFQSQKGEAGGRFLKLFNYPLSSSDGAYWQLNNHQVFCNYR